MDYGRDKGEVEKDAGGLGNMKNLGQVIAWLGQAIQPHAGGFPALETLNEQETVMIDFRVDTNVCIQCGECAADCPEIRATLRIPDDHAIGYALLFGHPAVQYHRPVKRGAARVNMLG